MLSLWLKKSFYAYADLNTTCFIYYRSRTKSILSIQQFSAGIFVVLWLSVCHFSFGPSLPLPHGNVTMMTELLSTAPVPGRKSQRTRLQTSSWCYGWKVLTIRKSCVSYLLSSGLSFASLFSMRRRSVFTVASRVARRHWRRGRQRRSAATSRTGVGLQAGRAQLAVAGESKEPAVRFPPVAVPVVLQSQTAIGRRQISTQFKTRTAKNT